MSINTKKQLPPEKRPCPASAKRRLALEACRPCPASKKRANYMGISTCRSPTLLSSDLLTAASLPVPIPATVQVPVPASAPVRDLVTDTEVFSEPELDSMLNDDGRRWRYFRGHRLKIDKFITDEVLDRIGLETLSLRRWSISRWKEYFCESGRDFESELEFCRISGEDEVQVKTLVYPAPIGRPKRRKKGSRPWSGPASRRANSKEPQHSVVGNLFEAEDETIIATEANLKAVPLLEIHERSAADETPAATESHSILPRNGKSRRATSPQSAPKTRRVTRANKKKIPQNTEVAGERILDETSEKPFSILEVCDEQSLNAINRTIDQSSGLIEVETKRAETVGRRKRRPKGRKTNRSRKCSVVSKTVFESQSSPISQNDIYVVSQFTGKDKTDYLLSLCNQVEIVVERIDERKIKDYMLPLEVNHRPFDHKAAALSPMSFTDSEDDEHLATSKSAYPFITTSQCTLNALLGMTLKCSDYISEATAVAFSETIEKKAEGEGAEDEANESDKNEEKIVTDPEDEGSLTDVDNDCCARSLSPNENCTFEVTEVPQNEESSVKETFNERDAEGEEEVDCRRIGSEESETECEDSENEEQTLGIEQERDADSTADSRGQDTQDFEQDRTHWEVDTSGAEQTEEERGHDAETEEEDEREEAEEEEEEKEEAESEDMEDDIEDNKGLDEERDDNAESEGEPVLTELLSSSLNAQETDYTANEPLPEKQCNSSIDGFTQLQPALCDQATQHPLPITQPVVVASSSVASASASFPHPCYFHHNNEKQVYQNYISTNSPRMGQMSQNQPLAYPNIYESYNYSLTVSNQQQTRFPGSVSNADTFNASSALPYHNNTYHNYTQPQTQVQYQPAQTNHLLFTSQQQMWPIQQQQFALSYGVNAEGTGIQDVLREFSYITDHF